MKSNSGRWTCQHGCNQALALKRTGRGCTHLEALLGPHGGKTGSQTLWLTDEADSAPSPEDVLLAKEADEQLARACDEPDLLPPKDDEDRFRMWLRSRTRLSQVKINVLALRICRGLTFREIAAECGYTAAAHAGQAFKDAIKMLQRGMK